MADFTQNLVPLPGPIFTVPNVSYSTPPAFTTESSELAAPPPPVPTSEPYEGPASTPAFTSPIAPPPSTSDGPASTPTVLSSSTEQTQGSGSPTAGPVTTPPPTASSTASGSSGSSFPLGAKIGIGVGAPIVVLLLVGALLLWRRRKRHRRSAGTGDVEIRDEKDQADGGVYPKPELDATETEITKYGQVRNEPVTAELDGDAIESNWPLDHRIGEQLDGFGYVPPPEVVISRSSGAPPERLATPPIPGLPPETSSRSPNTPPIEYARVAPGEAPSRPLADASAFDSQAQSGFREVGPTSTSTSTSDVASLDKLSALLERRAKIAEEQQELERMRRLREEAAAVDEEIRRLKEMAKKSS